jgi:hypothetical protein
MLRREGFSSAALVLGARNGNVALVKKQLRLYLEEEQPQSQVALAAQAQAQAQAEQAQGQTEILARRRRGGAAAATPAEPLTTAADVQYSRMRRLAACACVGL